MREIKFKNWDGIKMYNSFSMKDELNRTFVGPFDKDSIFLQFTGLKDKNGKEIYEGDIVKAPDGIWEIEFGEPWDGVLIDLINNYKAEASIKFAENEYSLADVKVIGNIYENKDLLK